MHKILTTLLLTLTLVTGLAAANGIDGEVLVKAGTTGNKALPTSQTTNVTISATSRVTDGASAVAFSLNSSNALSTGGAQSFQLQNAGTNIASILPSGAMRVGLAAAAGFDDVAGMLFEGASKADQASATLRNDTTDGNSFARWQLINGGADTTNQLSFSQIDVGNNDQYTYIQEQVGVGDEQVNTKFVIGGDNDYVVFKPFVSSSTTPYTFDTSLAHTSGNLMAVKNNGTNGISLTSEFGFETGRGNPGGYASGFNYTADVDVGGSPLWEISAHSYTNISNQEGAWVDITGDGSGRTVDFVVISGGPAANNIIELNVGPGSGFFKIAELGGVGDLVTLDPYASASTPVVVINSSLTHTSGDFVQFNNNNTNYVTFQPDQASTNTPITININGTLKRVHVGGPDSGGTGLRALAVEN